MEKGKGRKGRKRKGNVCLEIKNDVATEYTQQTIKFEKESTK